MGEVRRVEAGLLPRLPPPRPQVAPKQLCCMSAGCGQIFLDKVSLRHHFEIESVGCRPVLANHPRYHAYGMWWCEKCDQWFSSNSSRHDCTKQGTVDPTTLESRAKALTITRNVLRCQIRKMREQRRTERTRPWPRPAADQAGEVHERVAQAAEDVANNYLGGIAARAEAEAAYLGELGAGEVSEWGECMEWLRELSWDVVAGLLGVQTVRPSGKYTGPFQTAYRKCFALIMKVHASTVVDAKLLSKKLKFMLARLIYAPVDGMKDINKELLKRANRFLKGEWEGLFDEYVEAAQRVRGVIGQPTLQSQRARALRLMEEGLVAQSLSLLGESKICDVDREGVMEQLKSQVVFGEDEGVEARSPKVPTDLYSNPRYFCDTVEVEADEGRGRVEDNLEVAEAKKEDYVVMALRQMPRLGAQDWSGWRYDHIAALTKEQARWLVDIILNEEPEPEVRWLLTTAKVLPFEKEDGKARACIVGSMLRMFVARVVRLAMRKEMQAEYESFNQFGLGTAAGIDTAFHSVVEHHRAAVVAFLANPESTEGDQPVLVKYDFKSAFPSIYRDVAFEFAMDRFPQLCRYLGLLYSQPAQVTVTQAGVARQSWQMERGAMQGDPLGGDFFVCAKAEFAKELNLMFPGVWFSWIIDDLTCSMKASEVERVDSFIQERGAVCGLTVNEGKRGLTTLLPQFTVTEEVVRSAIPFVMTEGRVEGMAIGTATLGGWNKLLGCPVGSDAFCRARAIEIVEKKAAALMDINKYQNAQYEHLALALCGGVADYMVRMLHPEVVQDALAVLDRIKRTVLETTMREPLNEVRWLVAKAPSGGIGADIGDPEVTAAAQHLGSLGGAARVLARLEETHRVAGREEQANSFEAVRGALGAKPGLGGLVTQLRQIAEEVNIPNKILNIPPLTDMQAMPRSKEMAVFPQKQRERQILQHTSWTRPEVARLQSGGHAGAGLWLKVIPSLPFFRSDSELFLAMLRTRLQVKWPGAERVVRCKCNLKAVVGGHIDHHHYTSSCPSGSTWVGHQAVTKVIRGMYKQLEVPVTSEPPGLVWGTQKRPADVLVLVPVGACPGAGRPSALDVGITDAGTATAVYGGSWRCPEGALKAAEAYAKRKVTKFEKVKEINPTIGFDYRPIVFESTSARGPEAEAWWHEITSLAKDKESGFGLGYGSLMEYNGLAYAWSGQTFARHWGMRLSLKLMQATHRYTLGKISEYILEYGRRQAGRY